MCHISSSTRFLEYLWIGPEHLSSLCHISTAKAVSRTGEINLICFIDNQHVQFIMQKITEKDGIGFQWDHISPSVNTTNHMSSTKISRLFMDRPKASIVFASQQHCKSCISDPSQVKLSLAISTAAAVGFTHKCFVVSEWVHAAAWALTNTRLQVSSLVYSVLY